VRLLGDDDRSPGMAKTKHDLASVLSTVAACDWDSYLRPPATPADASDAGGGASLDPARMDSLVAALDDIMQRTHGIHDVVTDGFINHQLQV
jgi:expansin (peptidoglycan-binding protein)